MYDFITLKDCNYSVSLSVFFLLSRVYGHITENRSEITLEICCHHIALYRLPITKYHVVLFVFAGDRYRAGTDIKVIQMRYPS